MGGFDENGTVAEAVANVLDESFEKEALGNTSAFSIDEADLQNENYVGGSQVSIFDDEGIVLGSEGSFVSNSPKFNMEMTAKWLSEDYLADVQAGNRIAYYKLSAELGSGKFSRVKQGEHNITGDRVAVKIIEKARIDQKRHHVLKRELRMLDSTHHQNIARLFEYIDTLNRLYIVLELAPGSTLQSFVCTHGPLSELKIRRIYIQVVSALEHLHSRDIAHRDVKADNIVYNPEDGSLKLVDFGFACFADDDTFSTTFCGSPPYAAPELFSSKKYKAKPVDVWALGVLFYFMFTATMPFGGRTLFELKNHIKNGDYKIPKTATIYVERLIRGTMCMNPLNRMSIRRLTKCGWFSECQFPKAAMQISYDKQHSDPAVQKMVYRTHDALYSKHNVSPEDLQLSLTKGLREPLTGLYRLTYVSLLNRKNELDAEKDKKINRPMHNAIERIKEQEMTKKKLQRRSSKVCTII